MTLFLPVLFRHPVFKRSCFLLSLITLHLLCQGQINDSSILSYEAYMAIVKKFHPIIKQADISVQKSKAEITIARGAFDPTAYFNSEQKTFDGKNYYQYNNSELKIPTWYGIELKAGLEDNGGQFLNSETTTGQTSYIGISVPLAKNLLMDSRRAVLQQAKIFNQQSEAERLNTINDLLFDATVVYWNWVKEYQVYQIVSSIVQVNNNRLGLVEIGYRQGDRPAIDTIEALSQLQSFQFLQSESLVNFKNAGVELSNFLWLANNTYYQLGDIVAPDKKWMEQDIQSLPITALDELLFNARLNHPKLRMFNYKLQILEVERKLKFQSLLPMVNVKTNLLNRGNNVFKGLGAGFYENNNKFGVDIGLPLRLSEGRGAYKIAKLKILETNLDLRLQQQAIENKVTTYFNQLTGLLQQVNLFEAAYKNFEALYRGENIRFTAGESSLFLLNTRENKMLEAMQKLVDLKTKFYKGQVAVQWAAGQLR